MIDINEGIHQCFVHDKPDILRQLIDEKIKRHEVEGFEKSQKKIHSLFLPVPISGKNGIH
ncbi:MAG: hypothetical protein Q7U51_02600 [Methanoregula sp.]|nr:hypothetical protein [Methanoregula sp.]